MCRKEKPMSVEEDGGVVAVGDGDDGGGGDGTGLPRSLCGLPRREAAFGCVLTHSECVT